MKPDCAQRVICSALQTGRVSRPRFLELDAGSRFEFRDYSYEIREGLNLEPPVLARPTWLLSAICVLGRYRASLGRELPGRVSAELCVMPSVQM